MVFPLCILVQGVHWGGWIYIWPFHCVCRGSVYPEEVCTLRQYVHWGSVYTGTVCKLEYCVHWGSVYTGAVYMWQLNFNLSERLFFLMMLEKVVYLRYLNSQKRGFGPNDYVSCIFRSNCVYQ